MQGVPGWLIINQVLDPVMDDREYELRKAELALKEREVSAKEREGNISKWFNPLTIAIYVAAIGLFGNIIGNFLNNHASAEAEHVRAQSNLVLSVIKTNGNTDDACKNLNFFVNIGWLDDPKAAINAVCGTKGGGGVPTLPASSLTGEGAAGAAGLMSAAGGSVLGGLPWSGIVTALDVRVEDADSHEPISNAKVDLESPPPLILQTPSLAQPQGMQTPSLAQPQESTVVHFTTGATGDAILNFVSSFQSLTVSKDGYESVTRPMSQSGLFGFQNSAIVIIDLHRTPKSKH
jgi:hypothetical protein